MKELIDKVAVIAEIEKRLSDNKKDIERARHKNLEDYFEGYEDALALLKQQFINTLEIKEVDLKKLIDDYMFPITAQDVKEAPFTQLEKCAKYFFELGLKVQKGE